MVRLLLSFPGLAGLRKMDQVPANTETSEDNDNEGEDEVELKQMTRGNRSERVERGKKREFGC